MSSSNRSMSSSLIRASVPSVAAAMGGYSAR